jgi:5-methylcytosine-specific restriction endonuclease McrA
MPNRIVREGILTSERVKRRSGVWPVAVRRRFQDVPCVVCGSDYKMTIDHKVQLARGGSNDIENLQALCEACNLKKGAVLTDAQLHLWYAKNKAAIDADRRRREANRYNFDRF